MLSVSAHRSQCLQGGLPLFGKKKRLWPRIKVTRWLGLTFSLVVFLMYFFVCFEDVRFWARTD